MQPEQVTERERGRKREGFAVELQNVLSTTMAKMQAGCAINFTINKVYFARGTVLN